MNQIHGNKVGLYVNSTNLQTFSRVRLQSLYSPSDYVVVTMIYLIKSPTDSLVLPFMNSCMRSLSEDAPIKQTWLGTANVRREFPVSSAHACVQSVRKNIREDMEDRWVTNLSEDRKRFYLVSSLLDPRTKMLSFCDNKYFPSSWKDDALGYLSMDLKSFYM